MSAGEAAFAQWMRLVDKHLERMVGFTSADLPDWGYRDAHDDDLLPIDAAKDALIEAGWRP